MLFLYYKAGYYSKDNAVYIKNAKTAIYAFLCGIM